MNVAGETLAEILAEPVDGRHKSFPDAPGVTVGTVGAQGWPALGGPFGMPLLTLSRSAIEHNLAVMAEFCAATGVELWPHGKTHLSAQLWRRQQAAGAAGVTVATAWQARVFAAAGAERILVANEVVDPADLALLRELADAGVELVLTVDSRAGVDALAAAFAGATPPGVLVELGYEGGRAGVRTETDAVALAEHVVASASLRFAGIEGYEGVMPVGDQQSRADAVRRYLERARGLVERIRPLVEAGTPGAEPIASFGGSSYFDLVAGAFAPGTRVIIRSGCTLTHDHGSYAASTPFDGEHGRPRLRAAFMLWARVLSRPEPGLAIVGFGRRDAPYDSGLPVLLERRGDAGVPASPAPAGVVTGLNDQHAYLRVPDDSDLAVGDALGFGISHPCTAFDKWRLIPEVDDAGVVVDAVRTAF